MAQIALEIIVFALLATLAYAWVGYPVLLGFAARVCRGRTRKDFRAGDTPATTPHAPCSSARAGRTANEPPMGCPAGDTPATTPRAPCSSTRAGCAANETVTVLLAAYNEEANIRARLENLTATGGSWPVEIHVGIDACTDRTAEIAREFADRNANVFVHEFKQRRGKVSVLKDLVTITASGNLGVKRDSQVATNNERRTTSDDLLVFTDANTAFAPDAIERLMRRFDDPRVGGVCGRLVFRSPDSKGERRSTTSEHAYWGWETGLKRKESEVDSCLGANGAIYAIRRGLFPQDVPGNTIVDDFVIGMKVREQGYRMVYEPEAVAYEDLPATVGDEWGRRVRIGAGDFQSLMLCRRCLLPRYGRFALMFWSHKVLRWFTPHLILLVVVLSVAGVLCANVGGHEGIVSVAVLSATLLFLVLASVGRLLRGRGSRFTGFLRSCDYLLAMQAALFAGFLRFCRGGLSGAWNRTARENDA